MSKLIEVIHQNEIREANPAELRPRYRIPSMTQMVSPNAASIPMGNTVQPTRLFYGARFTVQTQGLAQPEAALVQSMADPDTPDISIDDEMGVHTGAERFDDDGEVLDVQPDKVIWRDSQGQKRTTELYNYFPFNRYSGITQVPVVQPGQKVTRNSLLARSNFTDEKGTMALGANARIAMVPYKGWSQDDATVISEAFAKRLTSQHMETYEQDFSQGDLRPGKDHFVSLFPQEFKREQLDILDDEGIAQPGSIVKQGDPLVLASRPRSFNSAVNGQRGLKREARSPAPLLWESKHPGKVLEVAKTRDGGVKVIVESLRPAELGDKIALRSGQKAIISKILPDAHMPRSLDGKPFDMLLNPLGLPSRANPELHYELLWGKIAQHDGKTVKLPWFNKSNESMRETLRAELAKRKLADREKIWDPQVNREIRRPVTTGIGHVLKLYHVAEKKADARGTGGYDANMQPTRGGGDGGGAKRVSGLETTIMRANGATNVLGEVSTLRGNRDDEFWRTFRAGGQLRKPKAPFVYHKFRHLLAGAGLHARDLPDGRTRLGLMTDKILEKYRPVELRNGETVSFKDMSPVPGGLFDPGLVGANSWAQISLDEPMPNPAAEPVIRQLLGLTKTQFEAILEGTAEFPD